MVLDKIILFTLTDGQAIIVYKEGITFSVFEQPQGGNTPPKSVRQNE